MATEINRQLFRSTLVPFPLYKHFPNIRSIYTCNVPSHSDCAIYQGIGYRWERYEHTSNTPFFFYFHRIMKNKRCFSFAQSSNHFMARVLMRLSYFVCMRTKMARHIFHSRSIDLMVLCFFFSLLPLSFRFFFLSFQSKCASAKTIHRSYIRNWSSHFP